MILEHELLLAAVAVNANPNKLGEYIYSTLLLEEQKPTLAMQPQTCRSVVTKPYKSPFP